MDPIAFLTEFGLPLTVAAAFGYFIWKQQNWIQKELVEDLEDEFRRLEGIIIKLIDQEKLTQLDVKHMKGYIKGIENIIVQLNKKGRD